uniref:Bifunctional inhibitor/plant lipid transfer protein/seed storage helical domain-containing protein n=1 Tax=Arundo donax TaxID=35708 RepID=A0A0A9B3V2_ARUDO
MFGGAVTQGCCVQLRSQQACLCQYARDPSYRGYVNSPAAQNAARECGLPNLKC